MLTAAFSNIPEEYKKYAKTKIWYDNESSCERSKYIIWYFKTDFVLRNTIHGLLAVKSINYNTEKTYVCKT